MTNTTALQVTNFDFYGDELIALKDNLTGEIYTSINSVLRGIGFNDNDQIRKKRDKWINDVVVSKGIQKFNIPTQEGVSKKGTPMNYQEVFCISKHKLPLALAKINITPSMKKMQPDLASKLELYQDKCADVLASVFIDHKTTNDAKIDLISEKLNTIGQNQEKILSHLIQSNDKSVWLRNVLANIGLLQSFLMLLNKKNLLSDNFKPRTGNITFSWVIHMIIKQAESINNKITFSKYKEKYESETNQVCKQVLDSVEYFQETRELFTETLNVMLNTFKSVIRNS